MSDLLAGVEDFAARLTIPSRDAGLVPMAPLYGTQRYALEQLRAGLAEDCHDFVILKGRQQGMTTLSDALDLYWPMRTAGVQGLMVADDDANRDLRRDVQRQMLATLPLAWRRAVRVDNRGMLAFEPAGGYGGSRLMYLAAGKREGSNLGRSRGVNFLHADEVGSWVDERAVGALQAALSERFPRRLYLWASTARGFNVFYDLWKTAARVPGQRAIFVGWWLHELYRLTREAGEVWEQYGRRAPTTDERTWMRVVQQRYEVTITREQLAWYRWQLDAKFFDDEVLLAQEHPCLPEDAFQAFGDKIIPPKVVTAQRVALETGPPPEGYRYEWTAHLDSTEVQPEDPAEAELLVWEEPAEDGAYVVAAHPWGSSTPAAALYVVQVYRAYPDRLLQVAEYATESGCGMHQFAWVCIHLAGAYKMRLPTFFILEVAGTGMRVLAELDRFQQYGYGLSPTALPTRDRLLHVLGSAVRYFYQRADHFGTALVREWKSQPDNRLMLLYGVRDELERGHLVLRSPALLDELAALRRGEHGDNDVIAAGGRGGDCRALTAALAVEVWLKNAMPILAQYVPPQAPPPSTPTTVGQALVAGYLRHVFQR